MAESKDIAVVTPRGEAFGCVVCDADPVCCSYATYDDGSHDGGRCREHCDSFHGAARLWPTYERMDCDA